MYVFVKITFGGIYFVIFFVLNLKKFVSDSWMIHLYTFLHFGSEKTMLPVSEYWRVISVFIVRIRTVIIYICMLKYIFFVTSVLVIK